MTLWRFYGASDDLVEIQKDGEYFDEIWVLSRPAKIQVGTGRAGVTVKIRCGLKGWETTFRTRGEDDTPLGCKVWCEISPYGYSVAACVECDASVPVRWSPKE